MKKQLDLGCSGFTRTWDGYECWGIDIVDHSQEPNTQHIKQRDLAIEPIPFNSNQFDLVTAYDFLEHLPMIIYVPKIPFYMMQSAVKDENIVLMERRQVVIELFNEIYRVLKHGGLFYSQTPIYPDKTIFQDPTHLSVWTDDSMNYFSGDYFGWHDHYGHTSRFEQVNKKIENGHLFSTLRAIKNVPKDTPYRLKYD